MRTIIICILMLSQMLMYSQQSEENRANKTERIQAQKIAYISTRLDLSVEEAQQFWPVYNEYNNELRALKKEKNSKKEMSEFTESDADLYLEQMISTKEKELAIQKEYLYKFKEVLPSKKVVQLIRLEKRFKTEIIENIEKRLKHKRNKTNK